MVLSNVWMWEWDHKEGWTPKNWWLWAVVLEKTLESPLDYKEIKSVNPKRNQSWIFIRRINTEAEAPILWPPDVKSWVIKNLFIHFPDVGKGWRQEKKGTTEDEMVGWHLWLNGHEFEQAPGNGEGQSIGSQRLADCSPWGGKESDTTEQVNNNKAYKFRLHWGKLIQLRKLEFLSN